MVDKLGIRPIGRVQRSDDGVCLAIDGPYRDGLLELDRFSHVIVLWWVSGHDNPESRSITTTELPYAPGVTAGVFACRSEYRPNPIASTVCVMRDVDPEAGVVALADIDAFDGTPVLDLKPYIPVIDRVENPAYPEWYAGWGDWLPPDGIGLWDEEE
jgi:tRNA-Thr(GGU) m(6)t(6)A37 methyltransferase TsaA